MPNRCQRPDLCMLTETCVPCEICPNAKEHAEERLARTPCSRLITQAELENVLTHEGIVEYNAIEDPCGYDNGKTELAVSVAARVLDEIARGKLKTGSCDWEENEDGWWNTDCGNAFEFTDGGPIYNEFQCCPYCGKTLTETPFSDDEDSSANVQGHPCRAADGIQIDGLSASDAPSCSEWLDAPTHTGWWLAWDVDGSWPYLLKVTDKMQPDSPALRVFFRGFWRVASECTWAKWKPIIPPNA